MTDGEKFYRLIQKKQERLQQLHDCSRNQLQYVDDGNTDALFELLGVKQKLLLDLEEIDRQMEVYRLDDPEKRLWPSPEMRQRCREAVETCRRLVCETLENDQAAEKELIVKKNAAQKQLRQFDTKANIQLAYHRQRTVPELHGEKSNDWGIG
ncbi:MAG: hypothetical protein FWC50_11635 [Planctomycetaceae bacterium]|nr:hypothetical protein [Planctomycetaceae bacterium]